MLETYATQLTPMFGGMSMRSGLTSYGAQHIVSLAKLGNVVKRIVGEYDVLQEADQETGTWLDEMCSEKVSIEELVTRHLATRRDSEDVYIAPCLIFNLDFFLWKGPQPGPLGPRPVSVLFWGTL